MPNQPLPAPTSGFGRLLAQSEILLGLGVVVIVGMMIIPLPTILVDLLLTVNIAAALTVILVSIYTDDPMHFSVFPTLLLITTLFRLALNVSTSRLILLQADAGDVVASFGNFVTGGNFAVGIVIFLILVIIQFVVITNGGICRRGHTSRVMTC